MFEKLKHAFDDNKDKHAAQDAAVADAPTHGKDRGGPTSQASGATAAPAVSHWAEEGSQKAPAKDGAGGEKGGAAKDGLEQRMVHDERFSEDSDVVQNGHGRILSVSVSGGRSRIMIGLGRRQGVRAGMEGYIKKGNGMLASFQIEETADRIAYASVDVTPDMIYGNTDVVVNPTHMPKSSEPQADMKSRIVGVSIVGGRTQIMVGRGEAHGARPGMHGHILGNGKPFARFELSEVHSTHSLAFVDRTIDELKDHHEIMLNPSGG